MNSVILPGKTIGILGGGQLGRMLCLAARYMGYRTQIYCPHGEGPASQAADGITSNSWDDEESLRVWLKHVDVVTVEFENVPANCMQLAEQFCIARPSAHVLRVAQHRVLEKQTLAAAGLPVTPNVPVDRLDQLDQAGQQLGFPLVLKTARSGYDGKGQCVVHQLDEASRAFDQLGGGELLAEAWIPLEREVSVLVARGIHGEIVVYPAVENVHVHHILDVSHCPAHDSVALQAKVAPIAQAVAECLDLVGLLCIEMFITRDQRVMINEIAPRPHNSGHLTIEAFSCDQFQQLIRAVCGLPLAPPLQRRPAAMVNLLGQVWGNGEPDWSAALSIPEVSLHLYGKEEPKAGRKMGHLTALGKSVEEARTRAIRARDLLSRRT